MSTKNHKWTHIGNRSSMRPAPDAYTAPFWGWFEAKTGIESLGHSGPGDWVFEFIIALCFLFFFLSLEWVFRRKTT